MGLSKLMYLSYNDIIQVLKANEKDYVYFLKKYTYFVYRKNIAELRIIFPLIQV